MTSRQEKLTWLLEHPDVWMGFPAPGRGRKEVFTAMRAAGLYAEGTFWFDAGIQDLINGVRRHRREGTRP